jgi:UPF0716 protein FxsA
MGLILLLLFLALPIAELYVIIQVADAIGLVPTLLLLILDGFAGAALARWQGRAAWARFNLAIAEGRVPAHETFDGAMIMLGGALLLAPGFITDAVGFLLLIPPTRALLRGLVTRMARRRVAFGWTVSGPPPRPGGPTPRPGPGPGPRRSPASRGYDYEGTAREVTEPDEIEPGERDG